MRALEAAFVDEERSAVAGEAARAPTDSDGFVAWFEALRESGPGQGDPLFPFLAEEATLDQMRWFLRQEVAGEAGDLRCELFGAGQGGIENVVQNVADASPA